MSGEWWEGLWATQRYAVELVADDGQTCARGPADPGLYGIFASEVEAAAEAAQVESQTESQSEVFVLGGRECRRRRCRCRARPYRPGEYACVYDARAEADLAEDQVVGLLRHGRPAPGVPGAVLRRAEAVLAKEAPARAWVNREASPGLDELVRHMPLVLLTIAFCAAWLSLAVWLVARR